MSPHWECKLLKPTDGNEGNIKANFLKGCSQNKINLTVFGDIQCRRKKKKIIPHYADKAESKNL